jgi:hypothetical protein
MAACLLAAALAAPLGAACDLDPAFGGAGYKTFASPSGGSNALGHDTVALSDGRLLVAGSGDRPGGDFDAAWWCVDAAGALQGSAGYNGVAGGTDEEFFAAAQAPGGGPVYLGGYAYDSGGNTALAILRLSFPALTPDAGFGAAGWVTLSAGSPVRGLAVDASGRLYSVDDNGLRRWLSSGAKDAGFGSGGILAFDAGGEALDLRLDSQGRVVMAGVRSASLAAWRVLPAGTLDPAFGNAGRITVAAGTALDLPEVGALTLGPDDGMLVSGGLFHTLAVTTQRLAWRVDPSGQPVAGFGSGGLMQGTAVSGLVAQELARGALGRDLGWLLLGQTPGASWQVAALWAIDAYGAADGTYGSGGASKPVSSPSDIRRPVFLGPTAYATGAAAGIMAVWRFSACSPAAGAGTATPTPVAGSSGAASAVAYPNPARGGLTLAWTQAHDDTVELSVHDERGVKVLGESRAMAAGPVRWSVDLSGLAPGVYFYRLRAPQGAPAPGKFAVFR